MSTGDYFIGKNTLVYQAANFATGLTVTAYIWTPDMVKSDLLTFTEESEGLYYYRHTFLTGGVHSAVFFENGTPKSFHSFRVDMRWRRK